MATLEDPATATQMASKMVVVTVLQLMDTLVAEAMAQEEGDLVALEVTRCLI